VVLCLDDEEETLKKDVCVKKEEVVVDVVADGDQEKKKKVAREEGDKAEKDACDDNNGLPNMDRLREELSCAICLEICFEPSTTPCGHSFCKKCLKCAAAKCGKRCPKCRQLISNGRSCTVNTVLWNTIQLLFPEEIEARRTAASANSHSTDVQSTNPETGSHGIRISNTRAIPRSTSFVTATQVSQATVRDRSTTRRRLSSTRSDDAELALRLQREEFMGVFTDTSEQPRPTLHSARANLRAMASRAYNIRTRGRY